MLPTGGAVVPGSAHEVSSNPPRATPPASMRPPRLRQVWSAMHLHRTIVRSQDALTLRDREDNAAAFAEVSPDGSPKDPDAMVSLLFDCHEVAARLATSDPPLLLDVRWTLSGPSGVADYRAGHIPGAHFVDLDQELSAPPGPGRHPLPDPASFGEAMRRHGVDASCQIVVYDAATA